MMDNTEDENVGKDKSDVDVILENDEDVNECSSTWPSSPLLERFCRPRFAPTSSCSFLVMLMMILTRKIFEQKVIQSISM